MRAMRDYVAESLLSLCTVPHERTGERFYLFNIKRRIFTALLLIENNVGGKIDCNGSQKEAA